MLQDPASCSLEMLPAPCLSLWSPGLHGWSHPRNKIPCREGVAQALKGKPGRAEHSLPLFSIPCPCFPSLSWELSGAHAQPMSQASHPSSGQDVLCPILVPSGMFEPIPCHGNLWISWNVGTSPCSVPWLCFPELQGGEQQGWAGQEGREESLRSPSCIHPHLGARPAAKASGFVQLAEQSRDPSESEIIQGENSGLKWDGEEERRICGWSDGLSHLYRLRLRQKESDLAGKSAAPPGSPSHAFQQLVVWECSSLS